MIAFVDQAFGHVVSLALSADGLTLAQVVSTPDMPTGFLIHRLDPTTREVSTLAKDLAAENETLSECALSPDGQRIAVGCKLAGLLFVFDTARGRSIAKYGAAHASPISAACLLWRRHEAGHGRCPGHNKRSGPTLSNSPAEHGVLDAEGSSRRNYRRRFLD